MMAMSRKMLEHGPGDIEALLPWYAAGTLGARDARRVEEALARDPALASLFAMIQEEYAATIAVNESLGAPSSRAIKKLFAAIDAEPVRIPSAARGAAAGTAAFLAGLSPRTLAWLALLGGLALLLQAGMIGALLVKSDTASFETASYLPAPQAAAPRQAEPLTRSLGAMQAIPRVLVRFAPQAQASEISGLLDSYRASIVESAPGGFFRLQIGDSPVSTQQLAELVGSLQKEKIIGLAVAAQ